MQLQDGTTHAASYISAGESGARDCGWAPAAAQLLVQERSAQLACAGQPSSLNPAEVQTGLRICAAAYCSLQEDQEEYAETGEKQVIPRSKRPVTKHWNWVGLAICLYYCAAALYYFVIRGTYTLNMGYLG